MNNENSFPKDAYRVETRDLTAEIRERINDAELAPAELVLQELRKVTRELALLRETTSLLQTELFQLRTELSARPRALISPYTAPDSRVRLS
jgi:hypothetical protein